MLALTLLSATLAASPVGLRLIDTHDASRPLDGRPRPLQVALWYPATAGGDGLTFADVVGLAASERTLGWPGNELATSAVRDYRAGLLDNGVPAAAVDAWLASPMLARRDAPAGGGRFPLVVIAQGNGHSLHEQAVLAEALAAAGMVVASSPSQSRLGDAMASDDDVLPSARQQARDLALAVVEAARLPGVDATRIAFVGHSFGARSALLAALAEPRTRALVSLDGGIGSANAPGWLDPATQAQLPSAPFALLHVFEPLDAFMAPSFATLRQLTGSDRYLARVTTLHHWQFTSFGWATATVPALAAAEPGAALAAAAVVTIVRDFLLSALATERAAGPTLLAPASAGESLEVWRCGAGLSACADWPVLVSH